MTIYFKSVSSNVFENSSSAEPVRFQQILQCSRVRIETQHFRVEEAKEAFERHQRQRGHIEDGAEYVFSLKGIHESKQSSAQ